MKRLDGKTVREKPKQIGRMPIEHETIACPHMYHYTIKNLFLHSGVMSKKECELCGETIVLDKKSKIKVITYAIVAAAIIVIILKTEPGFLVGNTRDEKMIIAMPLMLTIYIIGLFLSLRHVSFETYQPLVKKKPRD